MGVENDGGTPPPPGKRPDESGRLEIVDLEELAGEPTEVAPRQLPRRGSVPPPPPPAPRSVPPLPPHGTPVVVVPPVPPPGVSPEPRATKAHAQRVAGRVAGSVAPPPPPPNAGANPGGPAGSGQGTQPGAGGPPRAPSRGAMPAVRPPPTPTSTPRTGVAAPAPPPAAGPTPAVAAPQQPAVPAPAPNAASSAVPRAPAGPPLPVQSEPQRDDDAWSRVQQWLARESEASGAQQPARTSLLLVAQARIALDLRADEKAAEALLARAAAAAPDARFVALSRRWLAERRGRNSEVLALARAELALTGDAQERVGLLAQIAAIEEYAGNQLEAAEGALREAAALDPQDIAAWDALGALAVKRRRPKDAVAAWESLAAATDDVAFRAGYLAASAAMREALLEDTTGAQAAFERALEADANNVAAQAGIEPILLRARAWVEYARLLVAQAAQVGDPGTAREVCERAGDVLWECTRDGASAAACYERAAAMMPREAGPLEKLAAVLEHKGRFAELPRVYERLLAVQRDPVQQAAVLVRLGALLEQRLERPAEALRAYRRALDVAPTYVPAAQALAAVYRTQGRWNELVALELVEAERIADNAQRAARYAAVAELHEAHRGDIDAAIAMYERARATDVGNAAALEGLERIFRAAGRWEDLIDLYEKSLAAARDPRRIRALRLELATLHHERGGRPERAAELYRATLGVPQDELHTLVSLGRALADAGRWAEHLEVLEAQARLLRDEGELLATLYRIGTVAEVRLGDARRALAGYSRVLEKAPRHEAALRAVARVHESQSRWDEVVAAERRLLELAPRPEDAAATLFRIARICEERTGRTDDAIKAYHEALARAPGYLPALTALERLLRANGRHAQLAELLEKQAEAMRDPAAKTRLLCIAATVQELLLGDAARAVALFERALGLSPGHEPALWGIARLREARGEWPAYEAALQGLLARTEHAGARLRLLVRLARVHEVRLNNPAAAATFYDAALGTGAAAAALVIDRLRVARAEGQREQVGYWLEQLANTTRDARVSLGAQRLRALAAEYGGGAPTEASEAYVAALGHAVADPQVLDGLARNVARTEGDARLPQIVRARARATGDTAARALLLATAGALSEQGGRAQDAEGAYIESLETSAGFAPALDGLARLRRAAGDYARVADLLEQMGEALLHPQNVADALVEAGELRAERLGDPARALADHRRVLAQQPGHPRAFARAAQLIEAIGDHPALAALIAAHVPAVADESTRLRLLASRAAILADRIGDLNGAIADLERALAMRPEDPGLLAGLARLHERAQSWQAAAQTYQRLAKVAPDAGARREAAFAQATIWTQRVRDFERAREILEALVAENAADRVAATRLAEVAVAAGDFARARELYSALAREGTTGERAQMQLALSEVHRTGLGDLAQAHAAAGAAFALAHTDPAVVPLLEEHYLRTDDWSAYVTVGDEVLGQLPPGSSGGLQLRMSVAKIYRDKLKAHDPADRHLRAAIDAYPNATEPRIMLGFGLLGGNDHAAVAEFRHAIETDPSCVAAYRGLLLVCQRAGLSGSAALMASAVALLGEGGALVESALSLGVQPQPVANALPADDALAALVGPTRARYVRRVLAVIDPYVHQVFPGGQESLAQATRVPDGVPIAARVRALAAALGVPQVALFRGAVRETTLVLAEPRALLLPAELLTDAGSTRAMFDAAHALARVAAQSAVGQVLPADQVRALLDVATDAAADAPGYRELRKRLSSVLPRRARKDLERVVEEGGGSVHAELPFWDDEERRRARRLAVLVSRDLRAAAQALAPEASGQGTLEERRRALAANPAMADALRFAASEACWGAYRRLFGQG